MTASNSYVVFTAPERQFNTKSTFLYVLIYILQKKGTKDLFFLLTSLLNYGQFSSITAVIETK